MGGSIGTALLNTIAASVTARYATAHAAGIPDRRLLAAKATLHGFNVATWWAMAALLLGALVAGVVVNAGRAPAPQDAQERTPEPWSRRPERLLAVTGPLRRASRPSCPACR